MASKTCLATLALAGATAASSPAAVLDAIAEPAAKFGAWSKLFGGAQGTLEAFVANDRIIAEHNAGNSTYTLGHNQFSGLTPAEFKAIYLSAPMPAKTGVRTVDHADAPTSADAIDWVTKGAVTSVKDQGQCGSCWAFSTTGALEGLYEIHGHPLTEFSEQELVDCASSTGNQGCNGGLMDNGFKWIEENGGLCTEADYAYTGKAGTCHKDKCTNPSGSRPGGVKDLQPTDTAMIAALNQQPVSIAVDAQKFQLYQSGVLSGPCGTSLDHGVLAVGYGVDGSTPYYKVKNSWGKTWGEAGYIRLAKGVSQHGGQCGMLLSASRPTY